MRHAVCGAPGEPDYTGPTCPETPASVRPALRWSLLLLLPLLVCCPRADEESTISYGGIRIAATAARLLLLALLIPTRSAATKPCRYTHVIAAAVAAATTIAADCLGVLSPGG
jgi:hypothetical protein